MWKIPRRRIVRHRADIDLTSFGRFLALVEVLQQSLRMYFSLVSKSCASEVKHRIAVQEVDGPLTDPIASLPPGCTEDGSRRILCHRPSLDPT